MADMMQAARLIAAERERCAKIAEDWIVAFGEQNPQYVSAQKWACDAIKDIAEAIRNPELVQPKT